MNTLIVTLLIYRSRLLKNLPNGSSKQGFTLLELLITVMILGILASFAFPAYTAMVDKTKYGQAKTQMNCLAKEINVFYLENSYYPLDNSRDNPPLTKEINTTTGSNIPVDFKCFYQSSSGQVPFNSKYDYENWSASGGKCIIQITFLGKDVEKETINKSYNSNYNNPGVYDAGDDLTLSLGLKNCN